MKQVLGALVLMLVMGIAATANSYPACYVPLWTVRPPVESPVTLPIGGTLGLYAHLDNLDVPTGMTYLTVVVTDQAGDVVSGTLSYEERSSALLWTPTVPLEPGATYQVEVTADNMAMSALAYCGAAAMVETFEFAAVVGTELPAALEAPVVSTTLSEWNDEKLGSCSVKKERQYNCGQRPSGFDPCSHYWNVSNTYLPRLRLEWTTGLTSAEVPYCYVVVEQKLEDGTYAEHGPTSSLTQSAGFDYLAAQESYCVRVRLHRIIDDAETVSDEVCVSHSELVPIEHVVPVLPTEAELEQVCETVPEAYRSTPSDCDCSISSDVSPATIQSSGDCGCQLGVPVPRGLMGMTVFLVGLLGLRRRRAA